MINIPAWIADELKTESTTQRSLDKEVRNGTTIIELITDMVLTCPSIREKVYNPGVALVTEQITVALNNHSLPFQDLSGILLQDGDTIDILPYFSGG